MAATVTYNGVELGLVRTTKIEQLGKYDPSNTDMLYVNNRITVKSVISILDSLTDSLTPSDLADNTPADTMERIRHMLLVPRKDFVYLHSNDLDDTVLIASGPDTDANNGPKPISCNIVQVSERTYTIEYVIDVAIQDCDTLQQFASNRFEATHEIDHKGYSKVTTLGRVIVRSDMKKSPDALRPVVTPPLLRGFRRQSSYQLSHDGLAMDYKIVDTEIYLAPPPEAVEATGRYAVVAAPPGGIMYAQVDIRLEGRKVQNKRQLMERAVAMALNRLEIGGIIPIPFINKPWVMGGSLSEDLFANVVEVQLKGQILMGAKARGENAQKAFWQGFQEGAVDAGIDIALLGIPGAGLPLIAARHAKRAADSKALDTIVQDDPTKAPLTIGASIDSNLLDRFGAKIDGCSQFGSIDPGLRGNLPFLGFVAAAFRDPCVAEVLRGGMAANQGLDWSQKFDNNGRLRTPESGERAGHTFEFETNQRADESREYEDAIAAWQANELEELSEALGGDDNPSFNWLFGRLGALVAVPNLGAGQPGFIFGGVLIAEVDELPEFDKPFVFADPFPGYYETWFCEVTHDQDFHTDVLPATVTGYDAVQVQWANQNRTIKVRWGCTKNGFEPEMPMILGDSNSVIIKHHMELPNIEIGADGVTPIFVFSGETVYKTLSETYAEVRWPVPPWIAMPMRKSPPPIPSPSIVVTGGAAGAIQDNFIQQVRLAEGAGGAAGQNQPAQPGA